jgi:hypothetical protein
VIPRRHNYDRLIPASRFEPAFEPAAPKLLPKCGRASGSSGVSHTAAVQSKQFSPDCSDEESMDADGPDESHFIEPSCPRSRQSLFRQPRSKKGKRKRGRADSSDEDSGKTVSTGQDHLDDDVGISNTDAQEQTFIPYVPPMCNHPCLNTHPDELVETASLASVSVPAVLNKLRLPAKTLTDGLLTNAQAEVCLRAIAQHEIRLPNGQRSGFFMGDGAGVGKGRQQAAIIFHNFLHGRCKALWLSSSADLIDDARRDIKEIGGSGIIGCYDLKSYGVGQKLTLESGVLFCSYSLLVSYQLVSQFFGCINICFGLR